MNHKVVIEISLDDPRIGASTHAMAMTLLHLMRSLLSSPTNDLRVKDDAGEYFVHESIDDATRAVVARAEVVEGTIDQTTHIKYVRSYRGPGESEFTNIKEH